MYSSVGTVTEVQSIYEVVVCVCVTLFGPVGSLSLLLPFPIWESSALIGYLANEESCAL